MVEIYERNPELMEDRKVNSDFQSLKKKNSMPEPPEANVDRLDNDGIEGDADFNPYHDDVDYFE